MTPFTPNALLRPGRWVAALLMAAACTADQGVTGVSGAGPLLYVLNSSGNSVTAYAAAASGDVVPRTAILGGGSSAGLYYPAGVALDTAGRLYVANCCDQVLVFAPGATGNAAPIHAISGAQTALAYPTGIAFDAKGNLYVSNLVAGPRITAYAPGAEGNVAPIDTIAGANTGLARPTGIAFDTAGRLYVANGGTIPNPAGEILIYAPGANGNVGPIDSIAGSNTGLYSPSWIAFDTAGNLYVTNWSPTSTSFRITVYAAGAHGNAAPIRTIAGSNTGLTGAAGLTLDGAGNLYVANSGANSVAVYAPGATGNATPTTTIRGSNTGLAEPATIARDAGGKLYVVSSILGQITVYAPGASGDATPTATIVADRRPSFDRDWGIARDALGNLYVTSPANNTVTEYSAGASGHATPRATIPTVSPTQQTGYPTGITADASGNLYVTNNQYRSEGSCCYPSITIFAPSALGHTDTAAAVNPFRTVTGSATGLNAPVAIARDAAGNLYVANRGGSCCGVGNSITVYAADAKGNAAPTATIAGTLTGLNAPSGLALDRQRRIYVANTGGNSITIYAPGTSGNASPLTTIVGASTGLNGPTGVALDPDGNLYVANTLGNSITVYAPGASGNAAPLATIGGGRTGLNGPVGITF